MHRTSKYFAPSTTVVSCFAMCAHVMLSSIKTAVYGNAISYLGYVVALAAVLSVLTTVVACLSAVCLLGNLLCLASLLLMPVGVR